MKAAVLLLVMLYAPRYLDDVTVSSAFTNQHEVVFVQMQSVRNATTYTLICNRGGYLCVIPPKGEQFRLVEHGNLYACQNVGLFVSSQVEPVGLYCLDAVN